MYVMWRSINFFTGVMIHETNQLDFATTHVESAYIGARSSLIGFVVLATGMFLLDHLVVAAALIAVIWLYRHKKMFVAA